MSWAALPLAAYAITAKTCVHCGKQFMPRSTFQTVCTSKCLLKDVNRKEREKKERSKLDRMMDRAAKEGMKTIPQLKKEAQIEFNRYIRARDESLACISCGAPPPNTADLHAGRDAGHYRSTGAADHLRFDERNCHAQCVHCNQYKAGNVVAYRQGLVARIGLDAVEALESDNEPVKWTREALREIRTIYRARVRDMKKEKA